MCGRLVRGKAVTLVDGTIVMPEQCVGPKTPGAVLLIIECPSEAHLELLLKCSRLRRYYQDGAAAVRVACVVHLTPEWLVADARYRGWIEAFGVDTTHMISNRARCIARPLCDRWARHLIKLNTVHAGIFALPAASNDRAQNRAYIDADHLLRFSLSPSTGIDRSSLLNPLPTNAIDDDDDDDDRRQMKADDFAVHFLGTGSAAPALLRNVSGILLTFGLPDGSLGSTLLDAGEGSWAQMVRRFGYERAGDLLLAMSFALIGHMHADHHMGLLMMLRERRRLCTERSLTMLAPLTVVGPTSMLYFLTDRCAVEPLEFRFIDCEDLLCDLPAEARRFDDVFAPFGMHIGTVSVVHCPCAYGFVIERRRNTERLWKLVYSGDTRPCATLVEHGCNADLLIHEATFEHDMLVDAVAKRHSTATEAIDIAQRMGAHATILTHFSQRYPTIPQAVIERVRHINVSLAFDFMSVRRADLTLLPSLVTKIEQALNEEMHDDDDE